MSICLANNSDERNLLMIMDLCLGEEGTNWTPIKRIKNEFGSQQLFVIEFENSISIDEIIERSEIYKVPISCIYEGFSRNKVIRLSVVFMTYNVIEDFMLSKYIEYVLSGLFPECRDVSEVYLKGKQIVYRNTDYRKMYIDINDITLAYIEFLKLKYSTRNYERKLNEFVSEMNLETNGNFPKIEIVKQNEILENGGLATHPIGKYSNIIRCAPNSPSLYYKISFKGDSNSTQRCIVNNKRKLVGRFNFKELENKCELYRQYFLGERKLDYIELFGIASNLIQVRSGKNNFIEIINSEFNRCYYGGDDWNLYLKYLKNQSCNPYSCENFCPFHESCIHGKNIIETVKIKRNSVIKIKDENYVSIKEAEKSLEENFIKAQEAEDNCIHLIKAQTGLGKSTTYLKYLENSDKPYIIAVPTNKLKLEILEKALLKGYCIKATPSIPEDLPKNVKTEIERLYSIGAGKKVIKFLKKNLKDDDINKIDEYIKQLKEVQSFSGHIVTTHARLLTFKKDILNKFNLIIDEDIIRTLMKNDSVKICDLKKLLESDLVVQSLKDYIKDIIFSEKYSGYKVGRSTLGGFSDKDIDSIIKSHHNISSNIFEFIRAKVICRDIKNENNIWDKENRIHFLLKRNLSSNKIILLSATADEEIYFKYFGNERIVVHKCKKAKYKGNLVQYYEKSCSRTSLDEETWYKDMILDKTKDMNVITFKSYKKIFQKTSELHFGNTEGHNFLEGKDISIIGTPHLNEMVYKMYGAALGVENVDRERLKYQEVKNENFRFWFMTYDNASIRRIQFWLIESELEQSIGRARLLRNNCEVVLFSNFPIEQAILKKYK